MEQKANLTKDIREAKKILGVGPQSAAIRVEKHEVWIAKIQAEAAEALDTLDQAQASLERINHEISRQVDTLLETPNEKAQEA